MRKILCLNIFLCFLPILSAQDLPDNLQIGKHTVAEWKYIVDTIWGDGMPTEDKLILFDNFWDAVDKYYPGFVNNPVNWDSVRTHYRPEIEAGVSHGRFTGIMYKMGDILKEVHSLVSNDEVFMTQPGPGVPLLLVSLQENPDSVVLFDNGWFGAVITPVNENELLVLRAVPDHPLGLEAGDIILGYDGMAWKDLFPLLRAMDFPLVNFYGSSDESVRLLLLASVGLNWHFFDTLDFQKYGSADTLHMPTSLLEGKEMYIPGNEQIPLEGIAFPGSIRDEDYPELFYLTPIIYDTLFDNSIGYIYYTHMPKGVESTLFDATTKLSGADINGLILDLRFNIGGWMGWETGFNPIFNQTIDSCAYYSRAYGGGYSDLVAVQSNVFKTLSKDFINKPIALLTGPEAVSNGDYASYFIHTQPMTRSFGRFTNTGYTHYSPSLTPNTPTTFNNASILWDFGYEDWHIQIAPRNFGRFIDGELIYFIHNPFEIDEEIWYTQDAIHQQKDNMVERAVEWINSVAYADICRLSDTYLDTDKTDPLYIHSGVINPKNHSVELSAKLFNKSGIYLQDVSMQENTTGDIPDLQTREWYGNFSMDNDGFYFAEVSTRDLDEDSFLTYPGYLHFTTVRKPDIFPRTFNLQKGSEQSISLTVMNTSETDLEKPYLMLSSKDSLVDIKYPKIDLGTKILAGRGRVKSLVFTIDYSAEVNSEFWIDLDIYADGVHYWNDSIQLSEATDAETYFNDSNPELRIYPNPMSEYCMIQLSGPVAIEKIEVFDLSGRKVFQENSLGTNSYRLEKGDLRKGMYVVRITADSVYDRKLVVK
ncbi:MAG: T9SS type A sorting domain-containing protein [Bacteroidales bacterium]|nr:T9SS type A sorting domain-containing protein [Bacteroidales bacterium]MCF8389406.1 T9SS type A sorting domain-containing protein [Bacteroidales bacterium]